MTKKEMNLSNKITINTAVNKAYNKAFNKLLLSNNIRSIRAQAKSLPTELLESMYAKFSLVMKERQEQDKQAKQSIDKHNQKVEKYLELLKTEGIALTELLKKDDFPVFKKLRKKRPTRSPKYKYHDAQGDLRTWTGQGRMPKPIQDELNNNKDKKLDDFLILDTSL